MMSSDRLAHLLYDVVRTSRDFPDANLKDAFSRGQLLSKSWLIDELAKLHRDLGVVFVLGGWYGVLPLMMLADTRLSITTIRSFDIDPSCAPVADALNRAHVSANWRFKAVTEDMFEINYAWHTYEAMRGDGSMSANHPAWAHTFINTSCDHIRGFGRWFDMLPSGRLVVLQNNNFKDAGEDHVNTVQSLEEFETMAPMSSVLFSGTLDLGRYQRFMIIGVK